MQPIARIGDMVYFPECGSAYPILSGDPVFLALGSPVARVGDKVAVPGGGFILEGDLIFWALGSPVARVGDVAMSTDCGEGVIISGDMLFIDGGL